MRKRIVSITVCLALLIAMALPAFAEETTAQLSISTAEEFLAFAENCRLDSYSWNLTVCLEKDIDLGGTSFEPVPVFSGSFDGKGHIISGLSITADGSVQGLFRYLTATAEVQNLTVKGNVHPGGSRNRVGAIAGQNEGRITSCSFIGSVSGGDYVGGIAGVNTVTGIIENCQVKGEVHADHFVGGIAGENAGVIRLCTNNAGINRTPQQNDVEISDISMDTLTNTEAANTVTDIGGVAGISSGVIRSCKNLGDVGYRHMGYNIGGIAGTQSGYMVDCENYGAIQGRKEVGGIVGQLEPISAVTYSEDTLQILQGQLGELSGLVNQASGNAQANAGQISAQIGVLQEQTQAAQDAVEILLPDGTNPELPDPDASLAALNTLSTTLNAIPGTLRGILAATQATANTLNRDMNVIAGQVGAMEETIKDASENLGGSIKDVSDQDTAETLTGKVEGCINHGDVLADLNAGGVAGAIAVENDLDILEDWEQYGEESLNFQSEIRAVILRCTNQGVVTAKKQNAGGIVGWQALGLVKNSANTGKIDSADADYAGGISGLSTGYIRGSYAKCEIVASTYVGGIAGSGTIATDCLAQVRFVGGKEKVGGILGNAGETEESNPISGNYYLSGQRDPGAIDGISYSGKAEPMALDAFLRIEGLPAFFQTVTVRFVLDDGKTTDIVVAPGDTLDKTNIPAVPEKAGYTGIWDGLEDTQLENILFDMTIKAVYTSHSRVIASAQTRDNGLPIALAEGTFTEDAAALVEKSSAQPQLAKKETLIEAWTVRVPDGTKTVRFLLPDGADAGGMKLLIRDADGTWRDTAFTVDGSYLVFCVTSVEALIALVQVQGSFYIWLIAAISVVVLAALCATIVHRKKTGKQAPQETAQDE